MLHDVIASCVIVFCLWAIISPSIPTGFLCNLGAGIVAAAALWSIDDGQDPYATTTMLLVGITWIGASTVWRHLRASTKPKRRWTDWA